MNLPRLIGHRGAARYAPENTLASFIKAQTLGARWVETDVRLTRDHVPILLHDDSLKRTTGTDVLAHEITFEETQQYDAGGFFSPAFKGEKIPSLTMLLDFLKTHGMGLNLELKPAMRHEVKTAQVAMQALIAANFPREQVLISSFSIVAIEAAYNIAPDFHYGWLSDNDPHMEAGIASAVPFFSMNINKERASFPLIQRLKQMGYHVLCFTVNDRELAKSLLHSGVTSVFTDKPDLLD